MFTVYAFNSLFPLISLLFFNLYFSQSIFIIISIISILQKKKRQVLFTKVFLALIVILFIHHYLLLLLTLPSFIYIYIIPRKKIRVCIFFTILILNFNKQFSSINIHLSIISSKTRIITRMMIVIHCPCSFAFSLKCFNLFCPFDKLL